MCTQYFFVFLTHFNPCSGDSGGPLVREINGEWNLIGATSWAHVNCASTGRPQGWNNLHYPEYNEWIKEHANL